MLCIAFLMLMIVLNSTYLCVVSVDIVNVQACSAWS